MASAFPVYTPPNPASIWGEATSRTNQIVNPILAWIQQQQQQEIAEATARQQAIDAATAKAYQDARDPMANLWNSAIQQATAMEEQVASRLRGTGAERGSDFAARLAQMGAPRSGAAEELATTYKGAEASQYARGMSDVGRLVSRGAESRAALERGPVEAKRQGQAELAKSISDLQKMYGGQRGELMANLPGKIQEMYDNLYGQKTEAGRYKYESNVEAKKYRDTLIQQKFENDMAKQQRRIEQRLALMEMGQQNKLVQLERQWKVEDRQADQAFQREMAELEHRYGMEETLAGASTGGGETVETAGSAKRDRVVKAVNNIFWNPSTGQERQDVVHMTQNGIQKRINAVLQQQGVDPWGAVGTQIRRSVFSRLGIPPPGAPKKKPKKKKK